MDSRRRYCGRLTAIGSRTHLVLVNSCAADIQRFAVIIIYNVEGTIGEDCCVSWVPPPNGDAFFSELPVLAVWCLLNNFGLLKGTLHPPSAKRLPSLIEVESLLNPGYVDHCMQTDHTQRIAGGCLMGLCRLMRQVTSSPSFKMETVWPSFSNRLARCSPRNACPPPYMTAIGRNNHPAML